MIAYYVTAAVLFVTALGTIPSPNKNLVAVIALTTAIYLALFAGYRGPTVDRDYISYVEMFQGVPGLADFTWASVEDIHGDIFFYALSSVLHSIELDAAVLFISFSFLSLCIYYYCFSKFSPYPALSFFMYFCHGYLNKEMTQIRAGLASAIVLLIIVKWGRMKKIQSIIYSVISGMAHSSAVLVFVALIYSQIKTTRIIFSFHILLSILFAFTWQIAFSALPAGTIFLAEVQNYMAWDEYSYDLGFFNPILLKQIFFIYVIYHYKENKNYYFGKFFDSFFSFYRFSTLWLIAFSEVAILGARISNMFSVSELIIAPLLLYKLKLQSNKFGFIVILLYSIVTSVTMLFYNLENKKILSPYSNIFY